MKSDYGLRPNTKPETDTFPPLVHRVIAKFDEAEQSYFRANPGELGKNPKVAKAVKVELIVGRVVELRMARCTWAKVRAALKEEFGIEPSVSTLHRWAENTLTP
jgi:hypothetical protein